MNIALVIVLVGLASFLPRYLPMVVLRGKELPDRWQVALGYAPPAVLAALVFPAVLTPTGGGEDLAQLAPYLAGSAATVVAGMVTKKFLTSAAIGIVVFFVVRAVVPG
ncbi:AzlD domain-containing protein [Cellulomonas sp. P5_C5]